MANKEKQEETYGATSKLMGRSKSDRTTQYSVEDVNSMINATAQLNTIESQIKKFGKRISNMERQVEIINNRDTRYLKASTRLSYTVLLVILLLPIIIVGLCAIIVYLKFPDIISSKILLWIFGGIGISDMVSVIATPFVLMNINSKISKKE